MVSGLENFYDVLFEVSNEDRHRILLQLEKEAMNVTNLANVLGLSLPETSRHVSRLGEVGLTHKDVKGFYHLTPYGELVLKLLRQLEFTSQHREYFTNHTLDRLPPEFVTRIGDLAEGTYTHNVMDFLKYVENVIKYAEEKIWLLVDQYPVNSLVFINEALDRGVEFKCIEPVEGVTGPNPSLHEPEEMEGLRRVRSTPLVEQRTLESVDTFLFLSENKCVLAFPTSDDEFDYRGFAAEDERSLKWCMDLFQQYWETAEPRVYISPTEYVQPRRISVPEAETRGRIIVEGRDDSSIDYQAVQDAVDNYDEVILRGTFNFSTSTVVISRSVVIRGEGREDDVPLTKVYKSGWAFPFWRPPERIETRDHVFVVDGESIDVTIENIHFTDFNYTCIDGHRGNSMTIKNNRITLETGLGRGRSMPSQGADFVIGIGQYSDFPGGYLIEGNYLDFALSRRREVIVHPGRARDPDWRPDLVNHEYYAGLGIYITHASGKVIIVNNVIRNLNGRAITALDNKASAEVKIKNNKIVCRIIGSYLYDKRWAGFGIFARASWVHPYSGYRVEISDNTIECDKPNYCGIGIRGPENAPEATGKLCEGIVKNNHIQLQDGSVGVLLESCDGFDITDNTISGKAYYGIGVFPEIDIQRSNLGANDNIINNNYMRDLKIKDPDEYSKGLFDEKMYAGSKGGFTTAKIWLNNNTKSNVVKVSADETVVDEGTDNTIIFDKNKT